jgi:cell division protein FtsL
MLRDDSAQAMVDKALIIAIVAMVALFALVLVSVKPNTAIERNDH